MISVLSSVYVDPTAAHEIVTLIHWVNTQLSTGRGWHMTLKARSFIGTKLTDLTPVS